MHITRSAGSANIDRKHEDTAWFLALVRSIPQFRDQGALSDAGVTLDGKNASFCFASFNRC